MNATEGIQIQVDDYSSHGNGGHPLEGHLREMLEQHDSFIDRRRKAIRRSLTASTLVSLAIIIGLSLGLSHRHNRAAAKRLDAAVGQSTHNSVPTLAPASGPMTRAQQMHHFLHQAIPHPEQLDLNTTAQARAAHWMVQVDSLQLDIPLANDAHSYRFLERYVMAVFYFALQERQPWGKSCNFLMDTDVCRWNIADSTDSDTSERTGVMCRLNTGNGDVSSIRIIANNLTGTLPPELGLLTKLRRISLHNNFGIRGSIPDSFQNLQQLETVTLQINKLTGPIPTWIGKWSNLKVLGLDTNRLSGLLPTSFNQMTLLVHLALDMNRLSGEVGVLDSLTNLKLLYLDDNQFRGQLGFDALENLKALETLGLSNNDFVGRLPSYLFQMDNLTVLDLHGNYFTGSLPECDVNNALQFLALHDNRIHGDIPSSIANLRALTYLGLARNNLTQSISQVLGRMTNLESLALSDNSFGTGPIPDLSALTKLKHLSISSTHRTGTIPTWIGKLVNLLSINFGGNRFSGRLPEVLGNLVNLEFLLLNANLLTGSIPTSFMQLTKMAMLLIENNTITGTTTPVCALPAISTFVSDCKDPAPEIECICCVPCCHDMSPMCGDLEAMEFVNRVWDVGYERDDISFGGELYEKIESHST